MEMRLRWLIFALPTRKKVHKQHEMYMTDATTLRWGPMESHLYFTDLSLSWGFASGVTQILGFALGNAKF